MCSSETDVSPFSTVTSRSFSPRAIKSVFFATKSVSQVSSTNTILLSSLRTKMRPSDVALSERFSTAASPFSLRIFAASALSPLASIRAFYIPSGRHL